MPLRVSRDRLWLYGLTLIALSFLPFLLLPNLAGVHWDWHILAQGNWAYFVGAGATVGTRDLMGARHIAWGAAHGYAIALPWVYPPALAWLYEPFARIPLLAGWWINAVVMVLACVATGIVVARIYGMSVGFCIGAVLAWQPAVASAYDGENASIAMLLCTLFMFGIAREKPAIAGCAVGLLLFKPSDAAAFIVLLLLLRRWRAIGVLALFAVVWYLAGVPATAGDWGWPYQYLESMAAYYPIQEFAAGMIGLPSLLLRLGSPALPAALAGVGLLAAWCFAARRAPAVESASVAGCFAIAWSAHANPYEAAIAIPSIFFLMIALREPPRTVAVVLVYVVGAASLTMWATRFDPVGPVLSLACFAYVMLRLLRPRGLAHNPLPSSPVA